LTFRPRRTLAAAALDPGLPPAAELASWNLALLARHVQLVLVEGVMIIFAAGPRGTVS